MGRRTVRMVTAGLRGRERWALWKWTTLVMDGSCKLVFDGGRGGRLETYAATPNRTALPWMENQVSIWVEESCLDGGTDVGSYQQKHEAQAQCHIRSVCEPNTRSQSCGIVS